VKIESAVCRSHLVRLLRRDFVGPDVNMDLRILVMGLSPKATELGNEEVSLRALANARSILALRQDYPDVPVDLLVAFIARDQNRLIPSLAEPKLIGARTSDARSSDDDEAK
jgi:hypothetical protein